MFLPWDVHISFETISTLSKIDSEYLEKLNCGLSNWKLNVFAYSLKNLDLSSEGNYVTSTGRQIPGGPKSFQAALASSQHCLTFWGLTF